MKSIQFFMAFIFLGIFTFIPVLHARIDMVPHILVMEPRQRSTDLMILNLSDKSREFKVEIINQKQEGLEGLYKRVDQPLDPAFDPQKIVRFSPRFFTLGPNGKQKVRISLRKPANLPDGEYRFHIISTSYATEDESKPSNENVSVVMAMNFGISIPVIVRHGDVYADGKLGDFELAGSSKTQSGNPELQFIATREGNGSTLGEVTVEWAKDGGDFEKIGFLTGFNIFTELDRRSGAVQLNTLPSSGTLRVTYTDTQTNEVYDQIVFDL